MDVINVHGCDTTRLIMLADVAPTSHRNWSEATFPGVINWQKRIWLTIHDFLQARETPNDFPKSDDFDDHEMKLLDAVNNYTSGATFNYRYSHQLSVAVTKMQGLTTAIRRAPKDVVAHGKNYERSLAAQIIMLSPMTPHFASELWTRFIEAPNRVNENADYIKWDKDVFSQSWPKVDPNHKVELSIKANNVLLETLQIECGELNKMTEEQALFLALNQEKIVKYLRKQKVLGTSWSISEDYEGILTVHVDRTEELQRNKSREVAKQKN